MRPKSVTVVSWLIIVFSAFGFYGVLKSYQMVSSGEYDRMIQSDPRMAAMMKDLPRPNTTLILISSVAIAIQLVAGILTLTGRGIGRLIYLGDVAIVAILSFVNGNPITLILPSLILAAIFSFFLFRPAANAYFAAS